MTLCIAWRKGQEIAFSSDSRLSIDQDRYTDIGIKVMSVPVRIDNPIPEETGVRTTAYDHSIGLCYCDDTTTAHLIKETVYEILQRLQHVPIHGPLSFKSICDLVAKIMHSTAESMKEGLEWSAPTVELLLGGFCPLERRVVLWRLVIEEVGAGFEMKLQEVLRNEPDYLTMGSGKDAAEKIIISQLVEPGIGLLDVLKQVCDDDAEWSVGGFLQYGHFVGKDFRVMGVQDYEVDEHGWPIPIFTFRGTELHSENQKLGDGDLYVTGRFIAPFKSKIDDLMSKNAAKKS